MKNESLFQHKPKVGMVENGGQKFLWKLRVRLVSWQKRLGFSYTFRYCLHFEKIATILCGSISNKRLAQYDENSR